MVVYASLTPTTMSERRFEISSGSKGFLDGYVDDALHGGENNLCPPSVNCNVTKTGEAVTRTGYIDTAIDLAEAGKDATSFHFETFDLTFFALGGKVKYVDHNNSDAVVNTGISITDGTISRFTEYNGVVFVTNATDGAYGFLVTKLNGAVSSGAGSITTDVEGAAIASAFDGQLSPGTKNLRIDGTDEQYSSINTSTGAFTLSGTASQDYSDNAIAIVVYDLTSVYPVCSKLVPWKESMNCLGISVDDTNVTSDRKQTTLFFSDFAKAATSENIVTMSGGASGSELVGKAGKLTNAIATRDYLYLFKEDESYYVSVSDLNTSTGERPPQVISQNYGCKNEDLAADIGDGQVVFVTNDKRIIRIQIASDSGAAVVFPDETFDVPVSNILKLMDEDQSKATMFYDKADRRLYIQLSISDQLVTLVYDNNIGKWTPPHINKSFRSYYMRDALLYATGLTDDTIYEVGDNTEDDGVTIECVIAGPKFQFEDGRVTCDWQEVELSGGMSELADITLENVIDDGTPQIKTFDASNVAFDLVSPLGTVTLGQESLGGDLQTSELGDWSERFAIFPALGGRYQWRLNTLGSNHTFSVRGYTVRGSALTESTLTLK